MICLELGLGWVRLGCYFIGPFRIRAWSDYYFIGLKKYGQILFDLVQIDNVNALKGNLAQSALDKG